jgi:Phage integrase, N-terminal SAM-like domain/Phage integrase family
LKEENEMSALRQGMNEAMVLRGFAERTRETYLACVSGLAKHYGRSPDTLDAEAIQAYLLHLISERKLAYSSVNQAVCAIRFLFAVVLGQREVAFDIPMAKVPKRLPQILTREEISRLLAHARDIRARTLLTTTYAAGLRLSEVCNLQLADIESSPGFSTRCACTGAWLAPATGCFPIAPATARSTTRPPSAFTMPPGAPPASSTAAAFIHCAMPLPPIFWKPVSISTPSSAYSVTAMSVRPCATFIWRNRG